MQCALPWPLGKDGAAPNAGPGLPPGRGLAITTADGLRGWEGSQRSLGMGLPFTPRP